MNSFHYLQLSLMGFDWLIIHREHNSQHPLWVGKKKKNPENKQIFWNTLTKVHFQGLSFHLQTQGNENGITWSLVLLLHLKLFQILGCKVSQGGREPSAPHWTIWDWKNQSWTPLAAVGIHIFNDEKSMFWVGAFKGQFLQLSRVFSITCNPQHKHGCFLLLHINILKVFKHINSVINPRYFNCTAHYCKPSFLRALIIFIISA